VTTDVLADFEDSLLGNAESERTTAAAFEATLRDHLTEPAVGVSLPFEGVSLPDGVDPPTAASDLEAATTGVTPAGAGIASYGTVTVDARPEGDELVSLYAERHVAVVAGSDVYPDPEAAFGAFDGEFAAGRGSAVLETGPSATADMGSLVEGVHGPKEVHVIVLEDR
jgi:L-lactate dehydrogenase complex protein LldG